MSGMNVDRWRCLGAWPRKVQLRFGVIASTIVLSLIGMLFIWQSALLDIGDIGLPGPGFFPLVLAILLLGFAIVIAVGERHASRDQESIEFGHRDVLVVLSAGLMVPLLFDVLGAYITLGLFGTIVLTLVARLSILISIVSCALGMVASYYFFQVLLGVQMPTGPFG